MHNAALAVKALTQFRQFVLPICSPYPNMNANDLNGYQARMRRKQKRLDVKVQLEQQISKSRTTGQPVQRIQDAFVYVIENLAFSGWYKIGTTIDLEARLSGYQTADPHRSYRIVFSMIVPNRFKIETEFLEYAERSSLFSVKNEWVESKNFSDLRNKLINKINQLRD